MTEYEQGLSRLGYRFIAGVDEAGRGCLAGPVVAAAVVLGDWHSPEVKDSKQLSAKKRELLSDQITANALSVSIASVDHHEIDRINILEASRLAMKLAVDRLTVKPDALLIDALEIDAPIYQVPIIRGDQLSLSIAAASIIAKVYRDRLMLDLDRAFPGYGFASNKGYGTKRHREALSDLGPSPYHRKTFTPVKNLV